MDSWIFNLFDELHSITLIIILSYNCPKFGYLELLQADSCVLLICPISLLSALSFFWQNKISQFPPFFPSPRISHLSKEPLLFIVGDGRMKIWVLRMFLATRWGRSSYF